MYVNNDISFNKCLNKCVIRRNGDQRGFTKNFLHLRIIYEVYGKKDLCKRYDFISLKNQENIVIRPA